MFDCCGLLDWVDVCTDVLSDMVGLVLDVLPFISIIADYLGFTLEF